MKSIERMANVVAGALRFVLAIVERWSTKRSLIEWYERDCKKNTLVILYVTYKCEDQDIWTYSEQVIVQNSCDISVALKKVRKKIGANINYGYIIVEDKLIKGIIEQHMTV